MNNVFRWKGNIDFLKKKKNSIIIMCPIIGISLLPRFTTDTTFIML